LHIRFPSAPTSPPSFSNPLSPPLDSARSAARREFPLEQATAALNEVMASHSGGKVILVV